MPRYAANLGWLFTDVAFLDRFARARRAGFTAVEFASPYEHPAREVADRLAGEGLACVLFNLPMGDRSKGDAGIACRPGREREFRDGVDRALEYAAFIQPERVNVIAGRAFPGEDRAGLEALLVEQVRFAAGRFKAAGIPMLLEPLNDRDTPGFLVPRQDDGARVIAACGTGNVGLQLDLYHVAMMGDDAAVQIPRHLAMVKHVQFADAPGRGEPGTGRVPLMAQVALLDRLGYAGWVSAEYKPTKRTEDTLGWMPRA